MRHDFGDQDRQELSEEVKIMSGKYKKMKPEIKKQWINELRSGNIKQSRYKLMAGNGAMCCLGVLENRVLGKKYRRTKGDYGSIEYVNEDSDPHFPTKNSQKKAGLNKNTTNQLSRLNDERNLSFNEIADWVEDNL